MSDHPYQDYWDEPDGYVCEESNKKDWLPPGYFYRAANREWPMRAHDRKYRRTSMHYPYDNQDRIIQEESSDMALSDFKIESVDTWRHHDAAFVVLLGHACGWTIHQNNSGGVRMFSQDGTQVTVPDNTSLNFNVFKSWVSKVWRHRRTSVSPKAFEELVSRSKMDRPHVKQAWESTGLTPPTPLPTPPTAPDEQLEQLLREEEIQKEGEVKEESEARADKALERVLYPPSDGNRHGKLVSEEPNKYQKHRKPDAEWLDSGTVNKRTWSDGYVDYTCRICGAASGSPSGIGGHQQKHTGKRMETIRRKRAERAAAEATKETPPPDKVEEPTKPKVEISDVTFTVTPLEPPPPAATPEAILKQITDLLFPGMLLRIEAITAERDAAIARATKAEGDIQALRDLLAGS